MKATKVVATKRCLVCKRDISNQQRDSNYCLEKHTGSRKCRDKAANFMKRERRIYHQPTLFDVGFGSFAYFKGRQQTKSNP